jgi:hypothetical protein
MKLIPPAEQLDQFIDKFTPAVAATARAALAKMRKLLPGAILLVYDNYNALAIGFGPTERASDAIFSIAVFPRWVSLFFLRGANLRDPKKLLKGSGKVARHIVLIDAAMMNDPAVLALMGHALKRSAKPMISERPGRIVIKSVSKKQRPRRPEHRTQRAEI